ncbi:MOP flippase family protein [Erwiniaceae bacterium BAC15a-03b]|uniref:MOP flippase family protein n=1 Tax=Winslowiella arboricola TaxID=2978220 RepID=A0A9J6PR41_9GAMM|nr:MOP flippase family protein [Winslowiella arboricola]MCU5774280.1 MOP flippase family protein [Winslowiella arboricola]MCU5778827.1 MOP flippase family protein [Winslowiella arboricola]
MSLREKTVKGAKWSAISTAASIGINFLQITLLARLLEPHQFGLLTIAMVVIIIADTLSDFGISNSIIQRKDITEVELSTLYWINIAIGFVVFCGTFFFSHTIALLLKQPDLESLIATMAFAFLIIPHGQQFRALLQKELEFSKIGAIETLAIVAGFCVTMISAWFKPLAISAMWGYLVMSTVRTILLSWVGRKQYSPRFIFKLKTVKSNLRFGLYLTADALINQLNSNIATAVLSRSLGAIVAGGYNLAFNVAVLPPTRLNPIITRVLFPAFAKIQDDQKKLSENFYKLLSLVGLINFPALLGLMVVADNFVLVLFGEKWRFITPILQILCVVGLLRSIGNPIGSLLMAKARVDISFKFNVFKLVLFIPSIWLGAHLAGGIGAALGFLAVQVLNTYLSYFILIKPVLGSSYRQYINSIWLPLLLSLPTIAVAYGIAFIPGLHLPVAAMLMLQVSAGVIVFAITMMVSKAPLIIEIKQQLFKNPKLRKLLRA